MREPNARTSRLAIAAGVTAFLAVGGGGFLLGRVTAPHRAADLPPPPTSPPPKAVPPPDLPGIWGRADLLTLAARAADAAASGDPPPPDVDAAVGQRLDLALPFGCAGPVAGESDAAMRWRYDADDGTLRIRAVPTRWRARDWALPDQAGGAEGFWIDRPWSSRDSCPLHAVPRAAAESVMDEGPEKILAVGEFGEAGIDDDLRPKDRAFERIIRIGPEELDASRGFRLRLIGRIAAAPGGGPVRCAPPPRADMRPKCIVAIALTEVRLENPTHRAPLAVWENRSVKP